MSRSIAQRTVVRLARREPPTQERALGDGHPSGHERERFEDQVAVEEPLEIRLDGEPLSVTMRTPGRPGDDERLALGFLFAEGIIRSREDVTRAFHCGRPGTPEARNALEVSSAGGAKLDPGLQALTRRGTLLTSACGVCGRRSIDDLLARLPRPDPSRVQPPLEAEQLFAAIDALGERQPIFARTGGLHGAVICDASGVLAAAEDVGRHNAVDKVIGALLVSGSIPPAPGAAPRFLAVSGRASFELVQKAVMAGLAALASVSAPSSLAIDLAVASGLVLAGFVRGGSLNLYAGAGRVRRTL